MGATLSLTVKEVADSVNIANNTNQVSIVLKITTDYGTYNHTGNTSGNITVDGVQIVNLAGKKVNKNTTTTLYSGTRTITHNDDGSKSITVKASFDVNTSTRWIYATKTLDLTTIPRKSTLTVANGTLGTAQTLTITEKASTFKHKLKYTCGSASGWILGGSDSFSTSNSASWTPPLSLAQQNTTGTSVSVSFTLYTYTSDGASVGSNSYTKTFSIPNNKDTSPSVSISVSDPTGYATTYGGYVRGLSKLDVVVDASGKYGATIKSIKTVFDGKTYTAATFTTGAIAGTGNLNITSEVTDSRGRTAAMGLATDVLEYDPPKITALTAYRCKGASDGTASSSGAYIAVKFSAAATSLNSKNAPTYTIKYKKTSATSYTTKTLTDFAGKYVVSNGVYIFPADTASSYDITLTVSDGIKTASKPTSCSSVKKTISMLKKAGDIVGFAFGKIAELEGVFDVDMVIRARKGIVVDSPWVDLTIADGFALYGGTVANQPKYKVTGNVVTVMGVLSPTVEFTSSTTGVTIASGIPSNLRPSVNLQFVCQGSSMNRWGCSVTTSGTVTISRYGTTTATAVSVGAWLPFCVTYQI